jgi:superfamily I DNA/RNA helicase
VIPEVVHPPAPQVERPSPQPKPALFGHLPDDILLRCGLTTDQLPYVRAVCDEDALLAFCALLPGEVAERLLNAYGGDLPPVPEAEPVADPFLHPDTLRRFMTVTSRQELEAALSDRWESWTVFLHPAQRALIGRTFNGPARVAGSAGTGKTVVALHRAVQMATSAPGERVLLTTISDPLARALEQKLAILLASTPQLREQIEVLSIDAVVQQLARRIGVARALPLDPLLLEKMMHSEQRAVPRFSVEFLLGEWHSVVDAWHIRDWEGYRTFKRLGRMRRLNEAARRDIWQVMERIIAAIGTNGARTSAMLYSEVTRQIANQPARYAAVIVDECQDLTPYHLRFLAGLMNNRLAGLFFSGDTGQQIFQTPFSWRSVGIDIRGRSTLLKINYRTSHQIRRLADTLLDADIGDVDGNPEGRGGTHSVFSGPQPEFIRAASIVAEAQAIGAWIKQRIGSGIPAHEICIIVRSQSQLARAQAAAQESGAPHALLNEQLVIQNGQVSLLTMHLAKGLEFRSVVIMACDADVIPDMSRFYSEDASEIQALNASERQLLYVAMTRARDELVVSSAGLQSEYIVDLDTVAARNRL